MHPGLTFLTLCFFLISCQGEYTPKPRGYHRIDFPEKKYKVYEDNCPYRFQYPVYAEITQHKGIISEPCWININFKQFAGKIHISYKQIHTMYGLDTLIEDSRNFVYKHTIKADAINEYIIQNSNDVSGVFYEIGGNTASSMQFFVTDSTSHFIRGSFYFNLEPNEDSLAPVTQFIKQDIWHMIKTLEWKDS